MLVFYSVFSLNQLYINYEYIFMIFLYNYGFILVYQINK